MSQQRGISIEMLNSRRSRGSLPEIGRGGKGLKNATSLNPVKDIGESIAISDSNESSGKIMPKNINHFDEEEKNADINTVDPPFPPGLVSLGQYSQENQDLETQRIKFHEGEREQIVEEGFEDESSKNIKVKKRVRKISGKKQEPNFSFYSSIGKKDGDEEDEDHDLSIEEAKEFDG